jgi:hypothetical protein
MTVSDLPLLRQIIEVTGSKSSILELLIEHDVLWIPDQCYACNGPVSIHDTIAKCKRPGCRKSVSILRHSFFAKSRLDLCDTLLLGYLWLSGASYTLSTTYLSLSSATIVDYYGYFRALVGESLDTVDTTLGGPGKVVHVDESKFGKRKHNRGRRIAGAWVIGGVEIGQGGKFFAEVVERRDRETIVDVLSRHILPGTILHTDCWRGYFNIDTKLDVTHSQVNHSLGFIDNDTGVHTQSIEARWAVLKRKITLRGRVESILPGYLLEHIWRLKNKDHLWKAFLSSLASVYYE